jgi:TonB-dependent SusC/RagA subfamily outer membrane receptor
VAALNNNDFDYTRYDNIYEIIQSSFSGVQVINGEIIIRGTSSFNSSSAALIVVDGVISEPSILSTIRPIDVKNISVIKDGSTAVYGSRGANGVVIIDTKRGGD